MSEHRDAEDDGVPDIEADQAQPEVETNNMPNDHQAGPDDPSEPQSPAASQDAAGQHEPAAPLTGERPRRRQHRRAGILIGVLTAILGFAIAVQVHSNSSSDNLANAREDDLIRILDDQNARAERLNQQIADLQQTLDALRASGNSDAVARQQAEQEVEALRVLLGTLPATGPGIAVTITDPQHRLKAEDLLDVVEELRGAGAESIEFGPVRVGTSTNFTDQGGGVSVDGQILQPPYRVLAIGEPKTLDTALSIPGGVAATARNAGGNALISEQQTIVISTVRAIPRPRYATSAGR